MKDVVSLSGTAAGEFVRKNVENGIPVSFSGLSLAGTDAANYSLTAHANGSANITKRALTITGSTIAPRPYNRTTTAAAATVGTVGRLVDGEALTITATAANYSDRIVGTYPGVVVTYALADGSGGLATNYSVVTGTATGVVSAKGITVGGSFTVTSKLYDNGKTAAINSNSLTLVGVEIGDTVTLNPVIEFDNENVGTNKVVSLVASSAIAGTDASNYSLSLTGAPTSRGNITAKQISIGGTLAADSKTYDASAAATLNTTSLTLVGLETGDVGKVALTGISGAFADENVNAVSSPKMVSITAAALTAGATGDESANYSVTLAGAPTTTANITAKSLTISGLSTSNKVYNGNFTAAVTGTAVFQTGIAPGTGLSSDGKPFTGDVVSLSGTAAGTFAAKDVANDISVSFSGLSLAGTDAANYSLTAHANSSANITAKPLTISGLSASNKEYDGDYVAAVTGTPVFQAPISAGSGTDDDGKPFTGDVVSLGGTAVGAFVSKDVADGISVSFSGLSLTGAQAGNYSLTAHANGSANITKRALTITGSTIAPRQYDGTTTAAAVTVGTVGRLVLGETLTVTATAANYSDSIVGTYPSVVVTYTLANGTGGLAANYSVVTGTASAQITRMLITVTANPLNKTYATSPAADPTFTYEVSPSITGMAALSGVLSRTTGETAGQYDVLQNTLTNENNANYQITFVSAKFTIGRATQSTITITTTSTTYKVALNLLTTGGDGDGAMSFSLSDNEAGCSITANVLTATGNVGTTCKVTATKAQSTNYNEASSIPTTITFTPRDVTIEARSLRKTYGDTEPTLTYRVTSGVIADGETLSGTLSRRAGESAGEYLISRGTITNVNNPNYNITFSGTNNFTIEQRPISLKAVDESKEWNDPANADPALTFRIESGELKLGDTYTTAFSGAITRNVGEDWGTYAITQGTLTSVNYLITWTNGTFTIYQNAQNALVLSAMSTTIDYQATTSLRLTGGEGLGAVTYTPTDDTGACTVSGSTLTATRAGLCTVRATKAADRGYSAAESNLVTITINKIAQIIDFEAITDRPYSVTKFAVAPTTTSDATITIVSDTTSICTASTFDITMKLAGRCTITASAPEATNHLAATNVTRSFEISAIAASAPTISSHVATINSLQLSFTAGDNGGSAITAYEWSTDGGTTWTSFGVGLVTSPLTITGLNSSTEYPVELRAVTSFGSGAETEVYNVTTLAPPYVPPPTTTTTTTTTIPAPTTTTIPAATTTTIPATATTTIPRGPTTTTSTTVGGSWTTTTVAGPGEPTQGASTSAGGASTTTTTTISTTTTTPPYESQNVDFGVALKVLGSVLGFTLFWFFLLFWRRRSDEEDES